MHRAWLLGLWLALAPSLAFAQTTALGPTAHDGDALVVQGRIASVHPYDGGTVYTVEAQTASNQRNIWVLIDLPPDAAPSTLEVNRCGRFTGVIDGGVATVVGTRFLNLPYTTGAVYVRGTAGERIVGNGRYFAGYTSGSRATVTGCDMPRGDSNPADRFDPSTMLPQ